MQLEPSRHKGERREGVRDAMSESKDKEGCGTYLRSLPSLLFAPLQH